MNIKIKIINEIGSRVDPGQPLKERGCFTKTFLFASPKLETANPINRQDVTMTAGIVKSWTGGLSNIFENGTSMWI